MKGDEIFGKETEDKAPAKSKDGPKANDQNDLGGEVKARPDELRAGKLLAMNFQDLVNFAEGQGLDTYGKTKIDLLTELGVTGRSGGKVFVRAQPSPERLRYLVERNYPLPLNTIFPEAEFDDWMKIVAEQPFAFNGADLTNKKAMIQHTIKPKVKCDCGASIEFPKNPINGEYLEIVMCPGQPATIMRKGTPLAVRKCYGVETFRKYILHSVPK